MTVAVAHSRSLSIRFFAAERGYMAVSVSVRSYTHSVTFVANNVLRSLKQIVRDSGLDPGKLIGDWGVMEHGIKTWIESGHLKQVHIEIYDSTTNQLLTRWDVSFTYEWTGGDGQFWVDSDAIRAAILKAGRAPALAAYRIVVSQADGYQKLPGWSTTTLRSTNGMVEQRIGSTVEASGLTGAVSYYRRV